LVLDQLDDMSGLEFAPYLSKFGVTFPIIFMTDLDDRSVRRHAVALGRVAYLNKPFHPDQLINVITDAIRTTAFETSWAGYCSAERRARAPVHRRLADTRRLFLVLAADHRGGVEHAEL